MSTLALVPPAGPRGPALLGPANRCEVSRCNGQAALVVSNPEAGTSRRVCVEHGGDALLVEAAEPGEPARLTITRLG